MLHLPICVGIVVTFLVSIASEAIWLPLESPVNSEYRTKGHSSKTGLPNTCLL